MPAATSRAFSLGQELNLHRLTSLVFGSRIYDFRYDRGYRGTAMETFWSIVAGFGGVVGLASGIYVLLDRVTQGYPSIFIYAKPLDDFGRRSPYLRAVNRSERPILLTVPNLRLPGRFRVAEDHSIMAIISSVMHDQSTFTIDGKTTLDMPLMMPAGFDDMDPDNTIEITIRWRYVQPILLRGDRRVTIDATKADVRTLLRLRDDEMV
jgi:hypothetical protein